MMFNVAFPLLHLVDGALAAILPLLPRIFGWGALGGAVAMVIYVLTSNQRVISQHKVEASNLRRQMLDLSSPQQEYGTLMRENLKVSLKLLGHVITPSLLSTLPILFIASWLATFYGYSLPQDEAAISMSVVPADPHARLAILPQEVVHGTTAGGFLLASTESISVLIDGKQVYAGDPFSPPVAGIGKKMWWNFFFASEAGYLEPDAPIREIRFDVPLRSVISGLPPWASVWAVPFFLGVLVSTLAIKFGFGIQ